MQDVAAKRKLLIYIRNLIIPHAVVAKIHKQVAGRKGNRIKAGGFQSADSCNNDQNKHRLACVQHAADGIPDIISGFVFVVDVITH